MSSPAEIHDLGYRGYDGERRGQSWAIATLSVHSIQRALGLKRQARHKILPISAIVIAFVPAIVFVGLAAFLDTDIFEEDPLPSYGDYYGFIGFAIILFSSFVAPEVLCTDRRTGMLGLYLASPLDRTTYLVAKAAAVTVVLGIMTVGPLLLMLVAYTLVGSGPDGLVDFTEQLARILVSGLVVSVFFTAWSLAISSLTPRRAIASAGIVLTILVSGIVTGVMVEETDAPDEIELLDVVGLGFEFARRTLEEPPLSDPGLDFVSTELIVAATLGSIVVLSGFLWWRYQHIEVER